MDLGTQKTYDVALSFAGEDRAIVREIAQELRTLGFAVFFDEYVQAEMWGKDLAEHLAYVYSRRARYCVIFLSRHYSNKPWTRHEKRSALAKAIISQDEYILPVRIDDSEVPGILPTTGYVSMSTLTPKDIAGLISQKLTAPSSPGLLRPPTWDFGDWFPFANEWISQNPVTGDDFCRIMSDAGLDGAEDGNGIAAIVNCAAAERFCTLVGGRLPSIQSLEHLSQVEPHLLRAELFERGWTSYEWTRSVPPGTKDRYVLQLCRATGGMCRYFGTEAADPRDQGATISFRVAVLSPAYPTIAEDSDEDRA